MPGANLRYALALASAAVGDVTRARQEAAALDTRTASTRIMRAELEAAVATAGGERERAIELLKGAAAAKPAEALRAFQEGMRIYRQRTGLLLGASRAAAAVNQPTLAQQYAVELREIWRDADGEVPALAEVRRSTGQ